MPAFVSLVNWIDQGIKNYERHHPANRRRPPQAAPDPGTKDLRWNHWDGRSRLADWSSPLW